MLEGEVLDEVVARLLADEALARTVERLLTRWFEGPLYDEVVTACSPARSCGGSSTRSPTARR